MAFYELGVADSGILIGLPRQQLEESLETLEMMADEIGASVIVVKEIEVPPELSSLGESQLERWDGRRSTRKKDLLKMMKQDTSPSTSTTEFETEASSTDITDTEESTSYSSTTPLVSPGDPAQFRPFPTPFPFDPALAMFAMDPGEDLVACAGNEAPGGDVLTEFVTDFSVGLEITSVYKPRPTKERAANIASPPSTHFEYVKTGLKNGYPSAKSTDTTCHSGDSIAQNSSETLSRPNSAKAQFRRNKRDKRRELKHNTLLTHAPTCHFAESPTNSADNYTVPSDKLNSSALESLHISVVDPPAGDGSTMIASEESQFIVEALVVRELSLDEAYLDFEGFSLSSFTF